MSTSLFRTRLTKEFNERTARFHTSVIEDLRIFEDDIINTTAHDIMLHEQGIIPIRELKLILTALDEIHQKWLNGEITIGAEFEDVHEYIETKVIEKIGIEAGGMIHTGRSRNDQVVCDIKLRLREEILNLSDAVLNLVEAFHNRAVENIETLMILYTHGQHAQVGTFGAYLSSYADVLLRDFQRLFECFSRINTNPLGSGPVGGTSINIDRKRTTELLGFDAIHENAIDATSSRDWAVETAACCAIMMGNMSRIATDLLEWSAIEYGYIELADEYASSSSIMPQKKNPSTLELLRGKTCEAYSSLVELLTMEKGVPTGYYQDLQETKLTLWRTLDNTLTCLEVMRGIVETMKVKPGNMMKQVKGSFTMAVELAETLVNDIGLSFRESYKVAADLVNLTISRGQSLDKLLPTDIEESVLRLCKKNIKITDKMITSATDPMQCLMRRKSLGSPHPYEVKRMLRENKTKVQSYRMNIEGKRKVIQTAFKNLKEKAVMYIS